jgi:hypothetical protein
MSLLCLIGLHEYRPFAFNSVVNPLPIEECERCGLGRQWNVAGFLTKYTRRQMAEARADLAKRTAEAERDALMAMLTPATSEAGETLYFAATGRLCPFAGAAALELDGPFATRAAAEGVVRGDTKAL